MPGRQHATGSSRPENRSMLASVTFHHMHFRTVGCTFAKREKDGIGARQRLWVSRLESGFRLEELRRLAAGRGNLHQAGASEIQREDNLVGGVPLGVAAH